MNKMPGFREITASRKQAAEYLGVSVSTLARWASNKEGPPFYMIGARARYRYNELQQFIETKRSADGTA